MNVKFCYLDKLLYNIHYHNHSAVCFCFEMTRHEVSKPGNIWKRLRTQKVIQFKKIAYKPKRIKYWKWRTKKDASRKRLNTFQTSISFNMDKINNKLGIIFDVCTSFTCHFGSKIYDCWHGTANQLLHSINALSYRCVPED